MIGGLFTFIPLFIGLIFTIIFSAMGDDLPSVNYDNVSQNGVLTKATVTDIEIQENITINGDHPSIISYRYSVADKEFHSKYKILAPDRTRNINVRDSIDIKYLDSSSVIVGIEPFSFPFDIFVIATLPIFILGIIALVVLYVRVRKEIELFKHGKVNEAAIISMTPRNGFGLTGFGARVVVHYQYKTSRGQQILAKSMTTDFSILNNKRQGDMVKTFVSADNESNSTIFSKLDEVRNNWKI